MMCASSMVWPHIFTAMMLVSVASLSAPETTEPRSDALTHTQAVLAGTGSQRFDGYSGPRTFPKPGKTGSTAELSEDGYQAVAALGSNDEMKTFARRVLRTLSREVQDEGFFSGLVQFYSGEIAVQSFGRLREELIGADWTAPLKLKRHASTSTGFTGSTLETAPKDSATIAP